MMEGIKQANQRGECTPVSQPASYDAVLIILPVGFLHREV